MLMSCCELQKIKARNAIVEGDSFTAIQWGPGRFKCPWQLADWVEEIHHISAQLSCTFFHISREANDTTDRLARKGVFQ